MSFFGDIIGAAKATLNFGARAESDAQNWVGDALGKVPGASKAMQVLNDPYTYVISRPVSTVLGFADEEDYKESTGQPAPFSDLFSAAQWKAAWDNSATMSPGQAVVIGLNSAMWGNGNGQANINYSLSHLPDPENLSARENWLEHNSFANIVSGGVDLYARQADPVGLLGRHVVSPTIKDVLRRPVKASGLVKTSVDDVMARPSTISFLNDAIKKNFTQLSQDPRFKASPGGFKAAALMSAAKTPAEAAAIYRIGLGDIDAYHSVQETGDAMAQAMSQLEDLRSNLPNEPELGDDSGAIDEINQMIKAMSDHNADLTRQRVNAILNPIGFSENAALSPLKPLELESVKASASREVVDHAINMLRERSSDIDSIKDLAGKLRARTTGSHLPGDLGDALAAKRAALSIKNASGSGFRKLSEYDEQQVSEAQGRLRSVGNMNPSASDLERELRGKASKQGSPFSWSIFRPARIQSLSQNLVMDPLVRVYQKAHDVPSGKMVDFSEDDSVRTVRSFLNTFRTIEPDQEDDMLRRYAAASKADRPQVFQQIEAEAISSMARHYGLDDATAMRLHKEYSYRRTTALENVKSNAYGVLSGSKYGSKFKPLGDDNATVMPAESDSEVLLDPYLANQLERGALPAIDGRDLDTALSRMTENDLLKHAIAKGDAGRSFLVDQLDRVYGLWKPLTLLTGHRAYNHVGDDALRALAHVGALAVARNFNEGAGNFVRNRFESLTKDRQLRNLAGAYDKKIAEAQATVDGLTARLRSQKERAAQGLDTMPGHQVTPDDLKQAKAAVRELKANYPDTLQKHRLGTGTFTVPGTHLELPDLFGSRDAEALRNMFSSDKAFSQTYQAESSALYESLKMEIGHDVVGPSDGAKVHANALIKFVRNQLGPDPVFRRLARGDSESEVMDWLNNTADGRARLRDLHTTAQANVQAVRDAATRYLPSARSIREAATGRYTAKSLERDFPSASSRPTVHGSVALMMGPDNAARGLLRSVSTKLIKWTGSMPDDILVRHPLAATLYKSHMIDAVQSVIDQLGDEARLSPSDLEMIRTNSILQARHDMQHLLYDTSQFNDLGHTLRFVVPFYNAWYSALSNWSSLLLENPQLILRTYQAKRALWGSPAAIDTTTGEPATQGTALDNLAFMMHLPGPMARALGMQDLNDIPVKASTLLSPTYIDALGSPGWGPLVAVPVNYLAKQDPVFADSDAAKNILNGYIDSNSLDQLLPSVYGEGGDLGDLIGLSGNPSDSTSRANLMWSLYQEQMYDYMNGQRPSPPNWSDIAKQSSWMSVLFSVANRVLPLGFQPEKNHQFLTDQYQQMMDTDPQNADQDFYDKYGMSGFIFSQSLDDNTSGLPATSGTLKLIRDNQALLQQYPELASVLIGADQANQPYDPMALSYERAVGLRTEMTPQQAASKANADLGWTQYDMLMQNIDAQLAQRGLVSTKQTGASDLQQLKDDFVNATANPQSPLYNPDFYDAYGATDQNSYQTRIQAMEQLAMNPTLLSNPLRSDIASLNTYFQIRDVAYYWLQQRQYKSITDKSNQDIANWFDYQVGVLIQSDTKFQALYSKFLKNDNLTTP